MRSLLVMIPLCLPGAALAQTFSNPPTVAAPIANYSHVATIPAGSDLLVLAGQVGNAPDGTLATGVEAQYEQALANIAAILKSQGATPANLVKLTIYLAEPIDPARARAAREKAFGTAAPPSTLVYVVRLARPEIKVEIDAMAVRPKR
jgi:enamine deaminase RidA (YjgF/YER057c/UK114 family)